MTIAKNSKETNLSLSSLQKGFTPLHVAAKYGNLDVAKLLLQSKALPDDAGKVTGTLNSTHFIRYHLIVKQSKQYLHNCVL